MSAPSKLLIFDTLCHSSAKTNTVPLAPLIVDLRMPNVCSALCSAVPEGYKPRSSLEPGVLVPEDRDAVHEFPACPSRWPFAAGIAGKFLNPDPVMAKESAVTAKFSGCEVRKNELQDAQFPW